ncbi:potassium voltage-gated channel subfamily C member 1-like [Lineus longissimus]|uniref:potassium voltage-gated channel subfamily C member 1-like n=1 Tax=Lineus longissimus TaxID=88925 RepID=UPI00315DC774
MAAVLISSLGTFGMQFDTNMMTNRTRQTLAAGLTEIVSLIDTEKWRLFWIAERWWGCYIIDMAVNLIITVEFVVRFFVCPYKKQFLKCAGTIAEIIILMTYFLGMIMTWALSSNRSSPALQWIWLIMLSLQILRPLRMIRLAKVNIGVRVLLLVLRKSSSELFTVLIFLGIGTLLFCFLIFAAEIGVEENYPSIWSGAWWAVMTMTTVGYGDIYPKSTFGYLVGTACAISGMVIVGFSIPILSSNFNMYYGHVHIAEEKLEEKMKKVKQVLGPDKYNHNGIAKTEWAYTGTIATK